MEACSSYFLPRSIGMPRAMHLVTPGSVYPASHPLLTNFFSEILPTPEATIARALELADEVAKNTSAVSTKLMRDLMYRGPDSAEGAHLLHSRVMAVWTTRELGGFLRNAHHNFRVRYPGMR